MSTANPSTSSDLRERALTEFQYSGEEFYQDHKGITEAWYDWESPPYEVSTDEDGYYLLSHNPKGVLPTNEYFWFLKYGHGFHDDPPEDARIHPNQFVHFVVYRSLGDWSHVLLSLGLARDCDGYTAYHPTVVDGFARARLWRFSDDGSHRLDSGDVRRAIHKALGEVLSM